MFKIVWHDKLLKIIPFSTWRGRHGLYNTSAAIPDSKSPIYSAFVKKSGKSKDLLWGKMIVGGMTSGIRILTILHSKKILLEMKVLLITKEKEIENMYFMTCCF